MKSDNNRLKQKLMSVIKDDIKNDIVSELMNRYDEQIVSLESEQDPMKPSICRDEFEEFLKNNIESTFVVTENDIKFGIGDDDILGIGDQLDKETTDCLKIIGTILNGIVGEYILVTVDMAKQMFPGRRNYDLGRTGNAYLMQKSVYEDGMRKYGWPYKEVWEFSNFKGISDFFDVDIGLYIDKYIQIAIKGLK